MYILGHTTFAYFLIRPFLGSNKNYNNAKIILFIFVFANIIDAIHIGFIRMLGHNLIGTSIFAGFWLVYFYKFKIIQSKHFPILISATLCHVITDYWFSNYYILFPLTMKKFTVFGINSPETLIAESFFSIMFIIMFFTYQDHKKMIELVNREKKNFSKNFKFNKLFEPQFYLFYLFTAFYLFCIGQFVIFFSFNKAIIFDFVWYVWLAAIMFICFIVILSYILIKNPQARH